MALTDNLIAYYKCNQDALTTDSSGNSKTLSNSGVAEISSGKFNYGADFGSSGTSNRLYRTDSLSISTGSFTVNMWVKYNSTPSNNTNFSLLTYSIFNQAKGYHLFQYSNDYGTLKYYVRGESSSSSSNQNESTGTYYMITCVFNSSNSYNYLYRNASVIASVESANQINYNNTEITFGNKRDGYGQLFGVVDEIAVWNRVLTTDEITELYNSGSGKEIEIITTSIKSVNGLAKASIKSKNGLAIASVKSINGLS